MKSLRFLRKRTQPFLFAAMVSATIRRLHSGSCGNSYICNTSIKFWISGFWLHTHFRNLSAVITVLYWQMWVFGRIGNSYNLLRNWKKTNLGKDYKTNVRFMSMGNLKKDRKRVETSYGIRVIPVPFLENPFQVSSHDFGFFEQIWKGKQLSH